MKFITHCRVHEGTSLKGMGLLILIGVGLSEPHVVLFTICLSVCLFAFGPPWCGGSFCVVERHAVTWWLWVWASQRQLHFFWSGRASCCNMKVVSSNLTKTALPCRTSLYQVSPTMPCIFLENVLGGGSLYGPPPHTHILITFQETLKQTAWILWWFCDDTLLLFNMQELWVSSNEIKPSAREYTPVPAHVLLLTTPEPHFGTFIHLKCQYGPATTINVAVYHLDISTAPSWLTSGVCLQA